MKFVQHLIPKDQKILPKYFKGEVYGLKNYTSLTRVLLWFFGVFFCIASLLSLNHFLSSVIYASIGFLLIPPCQSFIERLFRFDLSIKTSIIGAIILLVSSFPVNLHYNYLDQRKEYKEKINSSKVLLLKVRSERDEISRQDSLASYLNEGQKYANLNMFIESNNAISKAYMFASSSNEKSKIEKEKFHILSLKAIHMANVGKYDSALFEINNLFQVDSTNVELIYIRALCFSKTGKIPEAVNTLKPLLLKNHAEANSLHEKINPLRRRLAYYVTRCRDGSTSSSKGSGACSHHGGVKNWNEPVYENFRQY